MKTLLPLLAVVGILKTGDAAITEWTTPIISGADGTGTLSVSDSQATDETITTYVAVTNVAPITSYSITTPASPFAISDTGDLTITTSLDADTTASYTLHIVAVDSTLTTPASGTATITVTVSDTPAFDQTSYTACIADGSTENTALVTVLAIDTGDTVSHSIANGNTNDDFTIDGTTGAITVDTGKTLNMATTPTYTLVVIAVDNETPHQTGTTTVTVTVNTDGICSGATAVAVSIMAILIALAVTM